MLSIDPWITLVVVLLSPLSFVLANFISKKSFTMFRKQSETRGELTGFTNEMLGGLKVVQAFDHQAQACEEFDEINRRLSEYSMKATFFSSITNPATRFMYSAIYAGVAIAGSFSAMGGALTVGQLSSFLSYTNQYTKPFNEITSVLTEFQNAIASAARVFALIDEPPAPAEPADAVTLTDPEGRIDLDHAAFSLHPGGPPDPGSQPGRGAGPAGGHRGAHGLREDHADQPADAVLRRGQRHHPGRRAGTSGRSPGNPCGPATAWCSRTPGSGPPPIRDNIAYGRPDASQEEIEAAARKAHAHSFIMRLPEGYDTVISEGGGNLSQGQKQLLCIARVMLCLPPMLILDEATSSIDTMTELRVQRAFETLMRGRTSFVVAHRLSTTPDRRRHPGHGPGPHRGAGHPRGAPGQKRASTPSSTTVSSRRRSDEALSENCQQAQTADLFPPYGVDFPCDTQRIAASNRPVW